MEIFALKEHEFGYHNNLEFQKLDKRHNKYNYSQILFFSKYSIACLFIFDNCINISYMYLILGSSILYFISDYEFLLRMTPKGQIKVILTWSHLVIQWECVLKKKCLFGIDLLLIIIK